MINTNYLIYDYIRSKILVLKMYSSIFLNFNSYKSHQLIPPASVVSLQLKLMEYLQIINFEALFSVNIDILLIGTVLLIIYLITLNAKKTEVLAAQLCKIMITY